MSPRPRGFIADWTPTPATMALVDQVQGVLEEYADQLPLTLRQIFYRLVGAHGYEKTERAYKRLCEAMSKARHARLIKMNDIRDDGFTSELPSFFVSVADFFDTVRVGAETLRLDRQKGQPRRLALWCEASGMVPQIARIADPYGIEVMSSGGFDSLTDKHAMGVRCHGQHITCTSATTILQACTYSAAWPRTSGPSRADTTAMSSSSGWP